VDKLVHVLVFLALAVTGRWAGIRAVVLAGLLVAYGAVSEVLQAVTPLERSGSVADVAADAVGVALGLGVWAIGGPARRARPPG
jgi:VanZ family protein